MAFRFSGTSVMLPAPTAPGPRRTTASDDDASHHRFVKAMTATSGVHASRALLPSVIGGRMLPIGQRKSPRRSPIRRKPNEKTSLLQRGEASAPNMRGAKFPENEPLPMRATCHGELWMNLLSIRFAIVTSIAAALLAQAAPAHAEKRVALLIGNNDYRNVPNCRRR
jgi:hypothetical protein